MYGVLIISIKQVQVSGRQRRVVQLYVHITRMDLGGILTYLHIQRYNGRKLDSLGLSFLVSWLDSHNPKKRVASNFFLYLCMTLLRIL